jgi:hypothetical protein
MAHCRPAGYRRPMTHPSVQAPPESKAQEGLDPRCVPIKLSAPIPVGDEIGYPGYSEDEHDV